MNNRGTCTQGRGNTASRYDGNEPQGVWIKEIRLAPEAERAGCDKSRYRNSQNRRMSF